LREIVGMLVMVNEGEIVVGAGVGSPNLYVGASDAVGWMDEGA